MLKIPLSKNFFLFRQSFFFLQTLTKVINYIYLNKYCLEINFKTKWIAKIFSFFSCQWYCQYKTNVDLIAIDYPQKSFRFHLIYSLLSYSYTNRIHLSINTRENMMLTSFTTLLPGLSWQEREVWDLFGIYFQGNNDLRRILTDYGFTGHPLRKDFPLSGFIEVLYDDRKKQVIYRTVSLAQEFRNFNMVNPWASLKI
jgi:NADH:ubiquinone oxidoreductase subunit C